jgi:hypothetical protein
VLVVDTRSVDADGALALLLKEILVGVLRLDGATCVGHYELYDELPGRGHQHHDQRLRRCPVRAQCPSITLAVSVRETYATPNGPTGRDLRAIENR